jgi:hypothetical protein
MAWEMRVLTGYGEGSSWTMVIRPTWYMQYRAALWAQLLLRSIPLSRPSPVFAMPCNGPFVQWWRGNTHAFGEDFGRGFCTFSKVVIVFLVLPRWCDIMLLGKTLKMLYFLLNVDNGTRVNVALPESISGSTLPLGT